MQSKGCLTGSCTSRKRRAPSRRAARLSTRGDSRGGGRRGRHPTPPRRRLGAGGAHASTASHRQAASGLPPRQARTPHATTPPRWHRSLLSTASTGQAPPPHVAMRIHPADRMTRRVTPCLRVAAARARDPNGRDCAQAAVDDAGGGGVRLAAPEHSGGGYVTALQSDSRLGARLSLATVLR